MVASWRDRCITEAITGEKLKEDKETKISYGPPYVYLGTRIQKFLHPDADENGPHCWSMPGDRYVNNIISNIE